MKLPESLLKISDTLQEYVHRVKTNAINFLPLPHLKNRTHSLSTAEGLVGVAVGRGGMGVAHVKGQHVDVLELKAHQYYSKATTEQYQEYLTSFVKQNALEGYPCNYVLPIFDYVLSLIEPPDVTKEELPEALRWAIKEYIDYPTDNAVVDLFELPLPRASDNAKIAYAVSVKKETVNAAEALINGSGLKLQSIDIPELALRNLACLYPETSKGALVMRLHKKGGYIIVVRKDDVFVHRHLELKLDHFALSGSKMTVADALKDSEMDELTLDVQRSMDYCRSLYRQSPVNSIVLMPSELDIQLLTECLQHNVGMPVHALSIKEHFQLQNPKEESEYTPCLMSIGSALRGVQLLRDEDDATN